MQLINLQQLFELPSIQYGPKSLKYFQKRVQQRIWAVLKVKGVQNITKVHLTKCLLSVNIKCIIMHAVLSLCVCVYKVILWLCCTRSIFFSLYVFLSTVLPPPTLCIAVCPHLTMHSAHYNCTNTQFKKTKTKNISMLKVLKINPPANWQLMILWTLSPKYYSPFSDRPFRFSTLTTCTDVFPTLLFGKRM